MGDIKTVWKALNSLRWMIDERIHIQQMAGTATVGYVPLYTHILKLKDGHKSFSGSHTDKDYWNVKKLELEKDILKEKSHIKQIAAASARSGAAPPASNPGPSGNQGCNDGKSAKQQHNAHSSKAYGKHQKAIKAAAKGAAAGSNSVPAKTKKDQ